LHAAAVQIVETMAQPDYRPFDAEQRPHPAMHALLKVSHQLRQYLAEFGLTPSARSRLHAVPRTRSRFEAWLDGHRAG
jgi:phage terminase small subunit